MQFFLDVKYRFLGLLAVLLLLWLCLPGNEYRSIFFPGSVKLCEPHSKEIFSHVLHNSASGGGEVSGVTGKIFQGGKILNYTGSRYFSDTSSPSTSKYRRLRDSETKVIKNWAVVTTIHSPSAAILHFAQKNDEVNNDWAIVIVGDKGAKPFIIEDMGPNTIFLDVAEQEELAEQYSELFTLLPWKHFGRKNIGYLYAISQGAERIWDFDDDNPLKPNLVSSFIPNTDVFTVSFPLTKNRDKERSTVSCAAFNPYPVMGSPDPTAWPRGFPLNLLRQPCNYSLAPLSSDFKIAIVQSLADNEPDVDGIFRLTRKTPFDFSTKAKKTLVIPKGTFVPFNAQATLVLKPALWSLLLPVSVHGRVSDIWRSYFVQRLLWDIGYVISFSVPQVNQFRNPHNPLGDMKAEEDLYYKSLALVERLLEWKGTTNTLPGRYEELIIDMYERGYIGSKDVALVQQWLLALQKVGYKFPRIKDNDNSNQPSVNQESSEADNSNTAIEGNIPESVPDSNANTLAPSETVKFPLYSVRGNTDEAKPSTKYGGNSFVTDLSLSIVVRTFSGRNLELWTTLIPGYLIFFPWKEWRNLDMVVVWDGDLVGDHYAGVMLGNLPPYPKIVFEDFPPEGTLVNWGGRGVGYCRQQYSNFYGDLQTDADVIGFVDTDTVFVSPVTPEYLFLDGKPIQVGVQMNTPDAEWSVGVRIALGTPKPLARMMVSSFPVLVKRAHFPLLRAHMIKHTNSKTFEEAFYKASTGNGGFTTMCQFDIIVTYLWYNHREEYSWHFKDSSINPVPYAGFFGSSDDAALRPTHHQPIMYVNKNGGHDNFVFSFLSDFICLASNYTSGSCGRERENGNLNNEWEVSLINNLRIDTWFTPHRWRERGHRSVAPFFINPVPLGKEDTVWETPKESWTTTWAKHVHHYTTFKENTKAFQWAEYTSHSIRPWEFGKQGRNLQQIDSRMRELLIEEIEAEYVNRTNRMCVVE